MQRSDDNEDEEEEEEAKVGSGKLRAKWLEEGISRFGRELTFYSWPMPIDKSIQIINTNLNGINGGRTSGELGRLLNPSFTFGEPTNFYGPFGKVAEKSWSA